MATNETAEVARIQSHIARLGLTEVTARYVPEHNTVMIRWPHATTRTSEAIEIPLDEVWVTRLLAALGTFSRSRTLRPGHHGAWDAASDAGHGSASKPARPRAFTRHVT